ncbi:MAG: CRTAC1 family protein [Balneolaceae bacterium]|nr:CRTAC1 family protein [Balneolaceae bacterium]
MGSNFGDLDNDGYLDFYIGTGDPDFRSLMPNRMFRNDGGKQFQEVTESGGFGHLQKGHGVSFADLDNDGDQDIFTVMGGAYEGDGYMNALFENPGGFENNWITLLFEGTQSNHFGIGTRITINVATPAGDRTIYRTVTTGSSFGSNSLQQEIGLGNATSVQSIQVFWPASGKEQVFKDVKMNAFHLVAEHKDQLETLERSEIKLGSGEMHLN